MILKRFVGAGANDLITAYRPCLFDEFHGNEINKRILRKGLVTGALPHCHLFIGKSGCGKTSMARLVSLSLNCEVGVTDNPCLKCKSCLSILNGSNIDFMEINVGGANTKGEVKSILQNVASGTFMSRYKVYIFDEAHELTSASINLLLKTIEDGYKHVYFIFCTNKFDKLKASEEFIKRCNLLKFDSIDNESIYDLIENIAQFEGMPYKKEILTLIAKNSDGRPRSAIANLNSVALDGTWELDVVRTILDAPLDNDDPAIINLCKVLIKQDFKESLKIYESLLKKYSSESIRIPVTGYFVGCLKKSSLKNIKFSKIVDVLTSFDINDNKLNEYKFYNCIFKIIKILGE